MYGAMIGIYLLIVATLTLISLKKIAVPGVVDLFAVPLPFYLCLT
jgi:hypothetical protein